MGNQEGKHQQSRVVAGTEETQEAAEASDPKATWAGVVVHPQAGAEKHSGTLEVGAEAETPRREQAGNLVEVVAAGATLALEAKVAKAELHVLQHTI